MAKLTAKQKSENKRRADAGEGSLLGWMKCKGVARADEDDQTHLSDLLTDLRHWAAQNKNGVNFDAALDNSNMHFIAESKGEN